MSLSDLERLFNVLEYVIENAVKIREHSDIYANTPRYDKSIKSVHELFSAFSYNENIVPVKLVLKEFSNKPSTLHLVVTSDKIKKADIKTATNDINQMNTATSAFTYNVAELLKKVKDEKIVENIPKQLRWHDNTNNEAKMYSRKDSAGRTLTDEQAEYFKDSKVRDENGNLLVVYHGTDADFTVFDRNKIGTN